MSTRRTVLAAIALGVLLAACGKSQESAGETLAGKALEASSGQDIDIREEDGHQTVTIEGAEGRYQHTIGENVPLPADFPTDITLPDDYQVMSVMTMGPAQSVVLSTRESMSALYGKIQAGQSADGWKQTVSMQGTEGSMLGFEKGDRGILVNLRSDIEGRTVVSLSLQAR